MANIDEDGAWQLKELQDRIKELENVIVGLEAEIARLMELLDLQEDI